VLNQFSFDLFGKVGPALVLDHVGRSDDETITINDLAGRLGWRFPVQSSSPQHDNSMKQAFATNYRHLGS
jgi:hypothetical protein